MTNDTKQLLLKLARGCENLFYEMSTRQAVLEFHGRPGWRENLKTALEDSALKKKCHAQFQPIYAEIQQAENLEQVIEKLIRKLPAAGQMN
jgi:hypothetical protein